MKISHFISILFIALFISQTSSSQNTRFELNRTINLSPEHTENKNITLKVNEKTIKLFLNIECKVMFGSLTVELYNPNGKKQGEFTVENQTKQKPPLNSNIHSVHPRIIEMEIREIVEGSITKEISNPLKGDWIVKLIPKKVSAFTNIQSQFISKD